VGRPSGFSVVAICAGQGVDALDLIAIGSKHWFCRWWLCGSKYCQTDSQDKIVMLSLSCIEYRIAGTGKGVDLKFGDDAVQRIAEIAWQVNESTENIGARRLHNVMERLLDIISFEAPDRDGESITIDAAYVNEHLEALSKDEDLSRFIL
jgi:hypothetical protein